jgi:MerR family transcriptional regulator, light-induced transcriptional regulator
MNAGDGSPMLRIGELSRRVGVSDHLLRAWESRYGLLRPVRSPGGFRLYSEADARRVRRMQAHLAAGLSAAEAAQAVLGEDGQARPDPSQGGGLSRALSGVSELSGALRQALDAFDEPAAQAVLDRLVSDLSMRTVLRDIVMPFLSELGERWEQGTASIAQEHFASNVLRGRLAGLARGWGEGHGPRAVLACPPGELHDLPLMVFGIVLNRIGWRIDYYGISTPVDELMSTVAARRPDIVVLASTVSENFEPVAAQLAALAQRVPLALAGAGATPEIVAAVGATLLTGDPVTAAENIGWPQ